MFVIAEAFNSASIGICLQKGCTKFKFTAANFKVHGKKDSVYRWAVSDPINQILWQVDEIQIRMSAVF